jgi:transcriptional regulator with XRE-family HTH domain
MPAKPLTPEQQGDAQRLMAIFEEHKTKHGLTQATLADDLGYSVQSSVSQYLKGKIPLNVEAAVKFAGRFGCAVSEFSPSIQKEIDRIAGFSTKSGDAGRRKLTDFEKEKENATKLNQQIENDRRAIDEYLVAGMPDAKLIDGEFSVVSANDDFVRFEIYDVRMSAGPGAEQVAHPDMVEYLPVLKEWANENLGTTDHNRIKLVTCSGVSMQPTIDDGSLMFVDVTVKNYRGDGLYCLAFRDGLIVKRLVADVKSRRIRLVSDNPDKTNYQDQIIEPDEEDRLTIIGQVKRWFKTCKP